MISQGVFPAHERDLAKLPSSPPSGLLLKCLLCCLGKVWQNLSCWFARTVAQYSIVSHTPWVHVSCLGNTVSLGQEWTFCCLCSIQQKMQLVTALQRTIVAVPRHVYKYV